MQAIDNSETGALTKTSGQQPVFGTFAIVNMCVGLFGIQIVWALHNGNTSRIFQTLGADIDQLPILWIAAPITGLLVQPVIGYLSDRTKGRWGRRRPYLVIGALLSALALFAMPNASSLWMAILCLWLLTASINVAMEPFRALVADSLPEERQATGFAMQVFFIGTGAVFASVMPWLLTHWAGLSGLSEPGTLPASVRAAYYIGGTCLLAAVAWTVLTTPEQPLDHRIDAISPAIPADIAASSAASLRSHGLAWTLSAGLIATGAALTGLEREIYVIAGLCGLYGLAQLAAWSRRRRGRSPIGPLQIVEDIFQMPVVLRRLAIVQFFTWFALFAMWIYAVPVVAAFQSGNADPTTAAYQTSADWVGIIFAGYNGVAALVALVLPHLVRRLGRRRTHALSLLLGSAGLLCFATLQDAAMLWAAAVGVGCAWAAILSLPYAMLASAVPAEKIGVYMGIHNIFVVLPQLVAATILGPIVADIFEGNAAYAFTLAAGSMLIAAFTTILVPDNRN